MEMRFLPSARRHRVGRDRALTAIENAGPATFIPSSDPTRSDLLFWIGLDNRNEMLEVAGFWEGDRLLIIHAMPRRYRR